MYAQISSKILQGSSDICKTQYVLYFLNAWGSGISNMTYTHILHIYCTHLAHILHKSCTHIAHIFTLALTLTLTLTFTFIFTFTLIFTLTSTLTFTLTFILTFTSHLQIDGASSRSNERHIYCFFLAKFLKLGISNCY